ncbi:MAG: D-glycero-beta-D-manno-heptose-7-phosphate kinase [Acidobacteria bacterium]|nr:D-glycero-beta-D-manno-heptose-7-phosphate kinase [Acidobacteriota bacterium]
MANLNSIVKKFSRVKVLVVGDVMLDSYLWGSVERISPEAPVPIVNVQKTSIAAGGAANVAANIAGLGAVAFLIGVTGIDREADVLKSKLTELKISPDLIVSLKNRRTTLKTRIVAHNQYIVRIDQESVSALEERETDTVYKKVESIIDEASIIVISDYAKGMLSGEFLQRLITTAKKKDKLILVDPKGIDFSKYRGATILTPNQRETAEACRVAAEKTDLIEKDGRKLLKDLQLEALLVTQGETGMTLLQRGGHITRLCALARKVYDVTGAGDTVIASFATAIGGGADFIDAAKIANISAGLAVEQSGTTAVTLEQLKIALKF